MITNIIQSGSIIILNVMILLLVLRVNRLDRRIDSQKFIKDYQVSRQLEDQPMCGCGHHQCFHDEAGCGKIDTWQPYNGLADTDTDTYKKPCGCKRYTGPEPLPTVIP